MPPSAISTRATILFRCVGEKRVRRPPDRKLAKASISLSAWLEEGGPSLSTEILKREKARVSQSTEYVGGSDRPADLATLCRMAPKRSRVKCPPCIRVSSQIRGSGSRAGPRVKGTGFCGRLFTRFSARPLRTILGMHWARGPQRRDQFSG